MSTNHRINAEIFSIANFDSNNLNITGIKNMYSGTGAPTTAPALYPAIYLNLTDKKLWFNPDGVIANWTTIVGGTSASYVRTKVLATAGQTSFTGLSYTVGYLEVYLNGVLLTDSEYGAITGNSVTLVSGASLGDVLEFIAYNIVAVGTTAAVSNGLANQLLYQTAPSATGFIPVGTAGQVLTMVSGVPTWATPVVPAGGTKVPFAFAGDNKF